MSFGNFFFNTFDTLYSIQICSIEYSLKNQTKKYYSMGPLSAIAESMVGSEIVKLGNDINNKIAEGKKIYNYTIGDFSPKEFPIPEKLKELIIKAYQDGCTNYPPGQGLLSLRQSLQKYLNRYWSIDYSPQEIQIASGGRPLIYAAFKTLVDPEDEVVYAVPSWNNNHYTYLNHGKAIEIEALPENRFMPVVDDIKTHIQSARLICLCTPQNPTGTTLDKENLKAILQLIVDENKRRAADDKKVFLLFDQMYSVLTLGDVEHAHPIQLLPEVKPYVITIDGISKSLAATGLRVGWAMGDSKLIAKMNALLSHIGAWAPMPEQVATASYLEDFEDMDNYLASNKKKIEDRLIFIQNKFLAMKDKGLNVDVIKAEAAIYLTVKIDMVGKKFDGRTFTQQSDITQFMLDEVGLALVPFTCFGSNAQSPWYRVSIGTSNIKDLDFIFSKLEEKLLELTD